ncbi:hypothetical protein PN462_05945 [Spirulina sp. CS-785/01]|uniref:LpqB family beta-propeller domain-containing protein n=1 Tax=Spirulina sp. CS-785/01 TaxID=3021716 RepID=UPI0023305570|nr:LpqB family beta-propeller domain-containing protein [Spirulina sp. CS-785/01]MDB9312638.1 hypothetical protein [Spirulina sp. CS-785/01]
MREVEIAQFAQVLELSAGTFRLFVARCNSVPWRTQIIEHLQSVCALSLHQLTLDPEDTQLYTRITCEISPNSPEILMVVGLEQHHHLAQLFAQANQERDKYIKNFSFPLVIWMSDRIFAQLHREASDLQSIAETEAFTIPESFWANFVIDTAQQRCEEILEQGATRFLPPLPSETDPAFRDALQAALDGISEPTAQTQAYQAFLQARTYPYTHSTARTTYETSLRQWPEQDNSRHRAIVHYCLGDWWRAQTRLHRRTAATAWEKACKQFQHCLQHLRQTGQSELVARFLPALGDAFLATQQWSALAELAQELLTLQQSYPHPVRHSQVLAFLAEVALAGGEEKQAEHYAREALKRVGREEAAYLLILARSQHQQNQHSQSLKTLTQALNSTQPQADIDLYLTILQALENGYRQQANYVQAYRYKRQQRDLETQFGLRAFLGAGRIQPQQSEQLLQPQDNKAVALEIRVSGRMTDVNELVNRIGRDDYKITILYGPSGVGKSSLVTGGLLPCLWQLHCGTESEQVLPLYLRSYEDWERVIGETLQQALAQLETPINPPKTQTDLLTILQQCINQRIRPVFLFDQFEEFFFVYPQRPERDQFFAFLGDCLKLLPLKVLFSLRVEYLSLLLDRPGFSCIDGEILSQKVRYLVDHFTVEQARTVVQNLVERAQLPWEKGLVNTVIADLAQGYPLIRPIELQIVGAQMQQESIETSAAYEKVGGKAELVPHYFTEVIRDCGKRDESLAGLVLFHLTNDQGQRPLKTQEELTKELEADSERLGGVLEILLISGLVVTVEDEPPRYQLVHDYLVRPIRHWYNQELRQTMERLERERQEAKRQQRFLRSVLTGGAVVAAVGFAVLGNLAYRGQQRAEEAAMRSQIRELAVQSEALREKRPNAGTLSGLLAVEAFNLSKRKKIKPIEVDTAVHGSLKKLPQSIAHINHDDKIQAVEWSPDGQFLATGSDDWIVRIVTIETGEEIARIDHDGRVSTVAWSPDGRFLATGSDDGTARIVTETGEEIARIDHDGRVRGVKWSPDGKFLTVSNDEIARVVVAETGEEKFRIDHDGRVRRVKWSPDGKFLATVSNDGTAKVVVFETGKEKFRIDHNDTIWKVQWSPDGRFLATVSDDKTARVVAVETGEEIARIDHNDTIGEVQWSPDGRFLATGSDDKIARVVAVETKKAIAHIDHKDRVRVVEWSPDGRFLATGSDDGTARVVVAETGKEIVRINHNNLVLIVEWSADGRFLATGSADETARVVVAETGKEIARIDHNDIIEEVQWSADGRFLATGSADETARVVAVETGGEITRIDHDGRVKEVKWSPDGAVMAIVSDDGTARVVAAETGKEITPIYHDGRVKKVKWSPDGAVMAIVSDDGTARVVAVETGGEITRIDHDGRIKEVKWSPDGEVMAIVSDDGTARVVAAETGGEITRIDHDGRIKEVKWSPDGEFMAIVSDDGKMQVNEVKTLALQDTLCQRLYRNLTAQEWKLYRDPDLSTYQRTCPNLPVHPSVTEKALHSVNRDPEQALKLLQHIAKIDPTSDLNPSTPDPDTDPQQVWDKATAPLKRRDGLDKARQGDTQAARQLLQEALQRDPTLDLNPATEDIEQDIPKIIDLIQKETNSPNSQTSP